MLADFGSSRRSRDKMPIFQIQRQLGAASDIIQAASRNFFSITVGIDKRSRIVVPEFVSEIGLVRHKIDNVSAQVAILTTRQLRKRKRYIFGRGICLWRNRNDKHCRKYKRNESKKETQQIFLWFYHDITPLLIPVAFENIITATIVSAL